MTTIWMDLQGQKPVSFASPQDSKGQEARGRWGRSDAHFEKQMVLNVSAKFIGQFTIGVFRAELS